MSLVQTWRDDNLAWIELNRPEKLNALGREVLETLCRVIREQSDDPAVRVLLLTGAGDRAFAAGADIAEMNSQDPAGIRSLMELGKQAALLLEQAPQPVVAVVNGFALGGGCELSLACDLVFAAEQAQFGLPEVDLAVLPGWGGSQRVERRVGYGRARDMVLSSRRVPATEALSWGLCDRVFPREALREEATAFARLLAAKDPQALAAAKRALRLRSVLPLDEGLAVETELFVQLFDRPERATAMGRFVRK
ncbi:MAG: Enoyl-CoA hydratase/isomerase [Armatimonadetes bacterium]|jgi:enoyl-CoA hydratase|nr:Enoyl-CoA hydratase/isomerase [Armatimonadota bacterium]